MTEELKTLEDLEGWDEHTGAVSRLEIKQELGIKWIKELEKEILLERRETQEIADNKRINRTIKVNSQFTNIDKIELLKDIFNIENKDLE